MPQLIALGLIGAVVWYAYRALKRHMASIGEEIKKTEAATKTVDALEKGEDGVYRPKKNNGNSGD